MPVKTGRYHTRTQVVLLSSFAPGGSLGSKTIQFDFRITQYTAVHYCSTLLMKRSGPLLSSSRTKAPTPFAGP